LAGQVLDSYNRTPIAATYIQVSEAGESGKSAAPIEVAADGRGYFMIQRLQPGHHYQLTARMKNGDRLLAGTAFATPPNPKILIQISEDFTTKNTPDPPGPPKFPSAPKTSIPGPDAPPAPVWPDQVSDGAATGPNGVTINPPPPSPPDQAWAPGNAPRNDGNRSNGQGRGAELGPPTGMFGAPAPASPNAVPKGPPSPVIYRPEGIAQDSSQVRADPLIEIRPQVPQTSQVPAGPARIPSCVLTGNTLYNFALYDLNGQPWEFRQHQSRLVLLDFWGTWCSHCLVSVKDLNGLQDRYGRYGLEVIGIDYEGDATPQDQVLKVRGARQRYGINYRILLGGNQDTCPVRAQFGVRNFPTAFLVDESNHVIWSSEGLGRQQLRELDTIIRQRLGLR
jgi:thiol-disulfide isomerase/thioredoxin